MYSIGAVSYTHLDVYKRQAPEQAGQKALPDVDEADVAGAQEIFLFHKHAAADVEGVPDAEGAEILGLQQVEQECGEPSDEQRDRDARRDGSSP